MLMMSGWARVRPSFIMTGASSSTCILHYFVLLLLLMLLIHVVLAVRCWGRWWAIVVIIIFILVVFIAKILIFGRCFLLRWLRLLRATSVDPRRQWHTTMCCSGGSALRRLASAVIEVVDYVRNVSNFLRLACCNITLRKRRWIWMLSLMHIVMMIFPFWLVLFFINIHFWLTGIFLFLLMLLLRLKLLLLLICAD